MVLWSSILKGFATTTIKGSGITLGSTMISCYFAIEIEKMGHKAVYAVFPHKYALVESAPGLTEDQLLAVRVYRTKETKVATTTALAADSVEEYSRRTEPKHVHEEPPTRFKPTETIRNIIEDTTTTFSTYQPTTVMATSSVQVQPETINWMALTG